MRANANNAERGATNTATKMLKGANSLFLGSRIPTNNSQVITADGTAKHECCSGQTEWLQLTQATLLSGTFLVVLGGGWSRQGWALGSRRACPRSTGRLLALPGLPLLAQLLQACWCESAIVEHLR